MENDNVVAPVVSAPAIPARVVRQSLRLNIWAGAIGMMLFAACNIPYTMLLNHFGATGTMQGVAGMIGQLAVLAQIPGAFVIEMLRRRKPFWGLLTIVHRFMWFVPAGVAWFMDVNDPYALKVILTTVAISSVMAQFTAAAWQSWMADLVPQPVRGQFWADRQVAISGVMLVATIVWGAMLDKLGAIDERLGFAVVFALAAAGGVADILIHFKVVEPAPVREPMTRDFLVSVWERLSGPLLHPGFRRLALAMGMWTFAAMMVGPFGNIYLRQKFDVSYSALSLIAATAALGTIVYCKGFGYLMDRLSARTVGGVCMVMGPLFSVLAWMFAGPGVWHFELPWFGVVEVQRCVAIITGVTLINAGFFGCVGLAHINLLADVVPQRGRTVAMAVQFVIISAFGALGAFAGGKLVDWVKAVAPDGFAFILPGGAPLDYLHILVGILALVAWCVSLPLLLGVRLPNEKIKFLDAVDRVVLVNPVRFATGIYNARILTQPSSRKSRFKAVEAIGNNATVIALADLVEKTRDPSVDIREAATHSLGKIGNAEAIHALAAIATQPDSDIAVPALRALRGCAVPAVAPALIPLLSHLNIEVVREAARTLGAARNPDAIDPLSNLLHSTRQAPVAVAAAEALSLLGDTSAIYAIIPRMRSITGDCFHRAYAVNAADLLGERDMFYKILTMDDHAHGAGLALLVKHLRTAFEHAENLKNSPLREDAFVQIRNIDLHYEARELASCAKNIFDLARAFAILRHNIHYRDDMRAFLAALESRDPLFTAGIWYIAVLNGALQRDDTPDSLAGIRTTTEALLGVFILASWSKNITNDQPG